ncbi:MULTISPECIES: hypothetical protein [Dyadobacter]|jgi:hypothetical protein|uniref:Entericidin n=1 Tax=Dyadobacter chenhuakuii TaxID=2909339 RepID=A0A9X1QEZ3_9BACT|nr:MULTISPECIES: hypothetical protein [Dyadobacter]MCE7071085.1 hypothetical protein [Dyadobacter sp. CY327]MCF2494028.1 hypothetical protein [Dyadobacter chenhuakuii]MCF2500460.1 hypothetical protein [Dyadobacter chenhuakuii]MCF2518273.1 hypothetical protein [Dyadobacter sp. CY351]USJ31157.1 hypothetical protein NFI80_00145 [Dyadobacter chenhuakuii]
MKAIVRVVSFLSLSALLSLAACNGNKNAEGTEGNMDSTGVDTMQTEMGTDTMSTDSAGRM